MRLANSMSGPMSAGVVAMMFTVGASASAPAISVATKPALVAPGDSNVAVPLYSGAVAPTVSNVQLLPVQSGGGATSPVLEMASLQTNLNPFGATDVTLALIVAAPSTASISSIQVSGFTGYQTAVEACSTLLVANGCGTPLQAGTASRSADGSVLTLNNPGLVPGGFGGVLLPSNYDVTDLYGIFTDASGAADPQNVSITIDGQTETFNGFSLSGPGSSSGGGSSGGATIPEPATAGLLSLGLAGLMLRRRC